jgi:hypothetical protein
MRRSWQRRARERVRIQGLAGGMLRDIRSDSPGIGSHAVLHLPAAVCVVRIRCRRAHRAWRRVQVLALIALRLPRTCREPWLAEPAVRVCRDLFVAGTAQRRDAGHAGGRSMGDGGCRGSRCGRCLCGAIVLRGFISLLDGVDRECLHRGDVLYSRTGAVIDDGRSSATFSRCHGVRVARCSNGGCGQQADLSPDGRAVSRDRAATGYRSGFCPVQHRYLRTLGQQLHRFR